MHIGFFVVSGSERPQEVHDPHTATFILVDPTSDQMSQATRTPVDTLWVDYPVLQGDVHSLRQFRMVRPTTRILIGHARDLTPPDQVMAQLVALGIYDFIPDDAPLPLALDNPATFADAVRWHGESPAVAPRRLVLPTASASGAVTPVADAERRAVLYVSPQRPVVIAVAGIAAGVGTSCVAGALAERLTALGQQTVLSDLDQQTTTFRDWQPALHADVAGAIEHWSDLPAQRQWSYIVLDCHTHWVQGGGIPEAVDLVIEVGPGAMHRWGRWTDWIKSIEEHKRAFDLSKGIYVIAPGPQADAIADRLRRQSNFSDTPILLAADVFAAPEATAWDPILQSVLPTRITKGAYSSRRGTWLPRFLKSSR